MGKQEARGLDAGPRLFDRLMGNGDARSASISKRIAEEEVGHVAVGVAWFVDVCRRLGLDPADRFQGIGFTVIFLGSFFYSICLVCVHKAWDCDRCIHIHRHFRCTS